ncbi:MAG: aldo/keto reductase, partial [Geminicoccales bacterium]
MATRWPSSGSAISCASARAEFAISTKVGRVYARPRDPEARDPGFWTGGLQFQLRFDYGYDGVMRSFEDS